MMVLREVCAYDFNFWSGGKDTAEELTYQEIETIFFILEDCNNGEPMTETEVNDFFWFERDTIAEWLGYNDFDEIMTRDED